MPEADKSLSVAVRSDEQGHWVEWTADGESQSLGPYQDPEIAENVRAAKEQELTVNYGRTIF